MVYKQFLITHRLFFHPNFSKKLSINKYEFFGHILIKNDLLLLPNLNLIVSLDSLAKIGNWNVLLISSGLYYLL